MKKGFALLPEVIMAGIFTVIVIGATVIIGQHLTSSSDYIVCEESYAANYAISKLSANKYRPQFKLLCYTQKMTIEKDGIYQESLRTKKHRAVDFAGNEKPSELNRKIADKVIEEMYMCQKQFAFGQHLIFSKFDSIGLFSDGETRCFKCASFEFGDSFVSAHPDFDGGALGTLFYSQENMVPNSNQTYWDVIGQHISNESYTKYSYNFEFGKTYEILFQSGFYNKITQYAKIGATAGFVYGAAVGSVAPLVGTAIAGATMAVKGYIVGAFIGAISGNPWYYINDFYIIEEKDEAKYCGGMV